MTEVAEQFTEERSGEVTRISHWIDGRRVEGTSGRSGPVYNPATGEQSGEVDFATAEEVDAAVQAAKRAFESWRTVSLSRRTELFFRIRELFHDHSRGSRAPAHARARQGALRREGRGRARARGDRVLLRHPELLKGELLGAGLDRDRRLLDPPAARRRGRDHAVQLPGDGAHVDVGARDRLREHIRAEALREGPVRLDADRRAAEGGRPPGRRLQRRARRQGRGRRGARAPGDRRGQLRRLDADRALRLRDRHEGTASACRRSAGRRTT